MRETSRKDFRCAITTVESKTKVCGMHTKDTMEYGYAIMTIESKVYAMHNKGRMDLGNNGCSERGQDQSNI